MSIYFIFLLYRLLNKSGTNLVCVRVRNHRVRINLSQTCERGLLITDMKIWRHKSIRSVRERERDMKSAIQNYDMNCTDILTFCISNILDTRGNVSLFRELVSLSKLSPHRRRVSHNSSLFPPLPPPLSFIFQTHRHECGASYFPLQL